MTVRELMQRLIGMSPDSDVVVEIGAAFHDVTEANTGVVVAKQNTQQDVTRAVLRFAAAARTKS